MKRQDLFCLVLLATLALPQWASMAQPPAVGGTQPPQQPGRSALAQARPAPPPQATEFEATRVVAIVGDEHILAGEVNAESNLFMAPQLLRIAPEVWQRDRDKILKQLAAQRNMLFKPMLQRVIDAKTLYSAYMMMEIPADKLEEAKSSITERVNAAFPSALDEATKKLDSTKPEDLKKLLQQESQLLRLALLMRETKITTYGELDQLLRQYGSSLAQQKRLFAERSLGQQLILKQINRNPEITHDQLLKHYYENIDDYELKAKARWEQLSVRFSKIPNKEEAYRLLAEWGNSVVFGANFGAVAKRHSHGSTASNGGMRDWTSQNALVSKKLDEALFTLPLNKLSRIIEDDQGFHIIRVLERKEASRVPFRDAQVKIKKDLRLAMINEDYKKAVKEIKKKIPVRILN